MLPFTTFPLKFGSKLERWSTCKEVSNGPLVVTTTLGSAPHAQQRHSLTEEDYTDSSIIPVSCSRNACVHLPRGPPLVPLDGGRQGACLLRECPRLGYEDHGDHMERIRKCSSIYCQLLALLTCLCLSRTCPCLSSASDRRHLPLQTADIDPSRPRHPPRRRRLLSSSSCTM